VEPRWLFLIERCSFQDKILKNIVTGYIVVSSMCPCASVK
jgi:hypothetical protein